METNAEVANQLFETIRASYYSGFLTDEQQNELLDRLSHLVYDDVCHLDNLIQQIADKHVCLQILAELTPKLDKLHFLNHVRVECRTPKGKFNPYDDPKLIGMNTQICEQSNNWVARFKFAVKHMDEKAPLFMLRMAQLHNLRTCERKQ